MYIAQWLAIGILAAWLWVVDTSHPPGGLLEQIGRIEGKIDAHLSTVQSHESRIENRIMEND